MERLIELTVGDRSGDGHEKANSYFVKATGDKAAIKAAYERGCKVVGWDLQATVCTKYEEDYIAREKLARLRELGYEGEVWEERYYLEDNSHYVSREDAWSLSPDEYVDAWAFFVELGGEKIEFLQAEDIHTGGYGCFH